MKTAILIVNLGTPSKLDLPSMKSYLKEFLTDPRVLNIPALLRWILVHWIIVPRRARANLKNYGKIWMKEGSPLMVYGERLRKGIEDFFGGRFPVELAMRYQQPSIEEKVEKLLRQGTDRIIVVPLYPQYASATTGSVCESLFHSLKKKWHVPAIEVLPPFYNEELYLDAVAEVSKAAMAKEKYDHYLFSYHGLPIRHLQIGETGAKHCKGKGKCCDQITSVNSYCYRAQCMATTRGVVKKLKLDPAKVSTAFQSRFGKDPWIPPFSTDVITKLAKKGNKKIAVFCPAFVADCIETLEEIDIGERENFLEAGGTDFTTIPCLNDSPVWIKNLSLLLKEKFNL